MRYIIFKAFSLLSFICLIPIMVAGGDFRDQESYVELFPPTTNLENKIFSMMHEDRVPAPYNIVAEVRKLPDEAIPILVQVAEGNFVESKVAINYLGILSKNRGLYPLMILLGKENEKRKLLQIIFAIGNIADERTADAIIRKADEVDPSCDDILFCEGVAEILGEIGSIKGLPRIQSAIEGTKYLVNPDHPELNGKPTQNLLDAKQKVHIANSPNRASLLLELVHNRTPNFGDWALKKIASYQLFDLLPVLRKELKILEKKMLNMGDKKSSKWKILSNYHNRILYCIWRLGGKLSKNESKELIDNGYIFPDDTERNIPMPELPLPPPTPKPQPGETIEKHSPQPDQLTPKPKTGETIEKPSPMHTNDGATVGASSNSHRKFILLALLGLAALVVLLIVIFVVAKIKKKN